jgi:type I restriction enzyme S subunit
MAIKPKELPAGWKWVRLGDVCEHITKGSTPTTYGYSWQDAGIVFLRSECVLSSGLSLKGSMCISSDAHAYMERSQVTSGDILIRITGAIGSACVVPNELKTANINQHIARIRLVDEAEIDTNYLASALISPAVIKGLYDIQRGSTHPHLSLAQVRDIAIPYPSLGEQKRIAAILNEQMAAVEKAKKAAEERLEAAKALPAAFLRDVFEGDSLISFPNKQFANLFRFQNGFAFKSTDFVETGVPVIKMANVKRDNSCDLDNVPTSYLPLKYLDAYRAFQANEGDVLVNLTNNNPEFLGVMGRYAYIYPALVNQRVAVLRDIDSSITPEYIFMLLLSPQFRKHATTNYSGGLQKNTSTEYLASFDAPLPPVSAQIQLTNQFEDVLRLSTELVDSATEELDTIETLPASLLRKAFSGEL